MKKKEEDIQLAENENIDYIEEISFEKKRELLNKTKIVKQTWSIVEIYQKIKENKLVLDPDYQRNEIWEDDKKTAFIESLYMGIVIPPIYVVEIPGENMLSENTYEVVDGKQRLSTIRDYLSSKLRLKTKALEYFQDYFGNKIFQEVGDGEYKEKTNEMLSSVLDIYVITANSPEFTKYDIFSRLNKGAEKLKVNEIRRAVYKSSSSKIINDFIENKLKDKSSKKEYTELFTRNDIKRYEDYGRFYRSLAFFIKTDKVNNLVTGYNSRPREMINETLQGLQNRSIEISPEKIILIAEKTIELMKIMKKEKNKDYIIDACIPFIEKWEKILSKIEIIKTDELIKNSLERSPSTTSNVNLRVKRINEILGK